MLQVREKDPARYAGAGSIEEREEDFSLQGKFWEILLEGISYGKIAQVCSKEPRSNYARIINCSLRQ